MWWCFCSIELREPFWSRLTNEYNRPTKQQQQCVCLLSFLTVIWGQVFLVVFFDQQLFFFSLFILERETERDTPFIFYLSFLISKVGKEKKRSTHNTLSLGRVLFVFFSFFSFSSPHKERAGRRVCLFCVNLSVAPLQTHRLFSLFLFDGSLKSKGGTQSNGNWRNFLSWGAGFSFLSWRWLCCWTTTITTIDSIYEESMVVAEVWQSAATARRKRLFHPKHQQLKKRTNKKECLFNHSKSSEKKHLEAGVFFDLQRGKTRAPLFGSHL